MFSSHKFDVDLYKIHMILVPFLTFSSTAAYVKRSKPWTWIGVLSLICQIFEIESKNACDAARRDMWTTTTTEARLKVHILLTLSTVLLYIIQTEAAFAGSVHCEYLIQLQFFFGIPEH